MKIISDLYIDIHTHNLDAAGTAIRNILLSEEEQMSDGRYYSVGLHPWYITGQNYHEQLEKVIRLATHHQVIAIGETGLDKITDVPFDLQMTVFREHIQIAETTGKPLIIHAVKSYNEIIQLKNETHSGIPWIVHGFKGKPELARMLLDHGLFLSIGPALKDKKSHLDRTLKMLPAGRFFLETDDSDVEIAVVYESAAHILGVSVEVLQKQIIKNFKNLFFTDDT